MVTRSAAPPTPPNGLGSPPFCGVGCGGVDWEALLPLWCGVSVGRNPLPSFSPCSGVLWWESPFLLLVVVWGSCGWEGIPSFPPYGVGSGGWEALSLPPVVWGLAGCLGGLVVVVKLL